MTEPVIISLKTAAKGGNPKPVFWSVSDQGMWNKHVFETSQRVLAYISIAYMYKQSNFVRKETQYVHFLFFMDYVLAYNGFSGTVEQ